MSDYVELKVTSNKPIIDLVSGDNSFVEIKASADNTLTFNDGGDKVTLTNLASPGANDDAATKKYVDDKVQGLNVIESVRFTSTGNVALSALVNGKIKGTDSEIDNLDMAASEELATGDRILLKDQTTASENGVYKVRADAGDAARSSDFDEDSSGAAIDASGIFTFVLEGASFADCGFVCTSDKGSAVVGTHDLNFSQFSSKGVIDGGTNITRDGNDLNLDANISLTSVTASGSISGGTISDGTLSMTGGVLSKSSGANSIGIGADSSGSPGDAGYDIVMSGLVDSNGFKVGSDFVVNSSGAITAADSITSTGDITGNGFKVGSDFVVNSSGAITAAASIETDGSITGASLVLNTGSITGATTITANGLISGGSLSVTGDAEANGFKVGDDFVVDNLGRITDVASITSTGAIQGSTIKATSDENFKCQIETITSGLDVINSIRPVSWNWREGCGDVNQRESGILAQQLQETDASHAVSEVSSSSGKHLCVNYNTLVGFLIAATKELSQQVDELKNSKTTTKWLRPRN